MKMKTKPMRRQKKQQRIKGDKKVYCVICEESGTHMRSMCDPFVHAICRGYSKDMKVLGRKPLATSG
jgi:hypothetical protein